MQVELVKAKIKDSEVIHQMQISAFRTLLEKYEDYDTNPGAETMENITNKIRARNSIFYIVKYLGNKVGAIRIEKLHKYNKIRISPVFIIAEFQNKGIGKEIFKKIEENHKPKNGWILETIKQEVKNCRFYEKLGYNSTGEIKEIKTGMELVFYEKVPAYRKL